jgi:AcrR family transcriptional regulator
MARDDQHDRTEIQQAAQRCLTDENTRNVSALAEACGIARSTLYRLYGDLVDDFRQQCAQSHTAQPGAVGRLRSDLKSLRERDRQRLERIAELETENHRLRNAARLLHAENVEVRAAQAEARSARIVRLDQPTTRGDIGAFSWEQLRAEHLTLINEHAETKAQLARARQTITKLTGQQQPPST